MSKSPEAMRSALANRTHRFIVIRERFKLKPTISEAFYVLSAIEHLKEARYEDGIAAIAAAERNDATPESALATPGLYENATASDLRAALRLVIRNED